MSLSLWKHRKLYPATQSGGVSLVGQPGRWKGAVKFDQGVQCAEAGTNLIRNPDVEVDLTDWNEGITATGSRERSIEQANWGIASLKTTMLTSGAADQAIGGWMSITGLAAATAYTFSSDLYVPLLASAKARVLIVWKDAGSATISSTSVDLVTTINSGFVRVRTTQTSPALTAQANIYIDLVSTAASAKGIAYWDGIQFIALAYDIPVIMGSLDGCAWSGTAHASTSTRSNPQLYYAIDGLDEDLAVVIRYRTPPEFNNARGQEFTFFQFAANGANRLEFKLRHVTGDEGKFRLGLWDINATQLEVTGTFQHVANTEYYAALRLTGSGTQTAYEFLRATSTATSFTSDASGNLAGRRQKLAGNLWIGTNKFNDARCFNGIFDGMWFVPGGMTKAELDDWLKAGGVGPPTGAKYGSGFNEDYRLEQGEAISFDHGAYKVLEVPTPGYVPQRPLPERATYGGSTFRHGAELANAYYDNVVDESIALLMTGTSVDNLAYNADRLQRICDAARRQPEAEREDIVELRYMPYGGGVQVRARVFRAALTLPENFSSQLMWQGYTLVEATVVLEREALWRGWRIKTVDDRQRTNWHATNPTSPFSVTSVLGDVETPVRVIIENDHASLGYDKLWMATAPTIGTPLVFFYEPPNTTALADAYGGSVNLGTAGTSTTYTGIGSISTSVSRETRHYRAFVVCAVGGAGTAINVRLNAVSNDFTKRAYRLHDAQFTFTPSGTTLAAYDLGDITFPPKAQGLGTGLYAATVYPGFNVASGTMSIRLDSLLFFETAQGICDATAGTADWLNGADERLIWDTPSSLVACFNATEANADLGAVTARSGPGLYFSPGDNSVKVWVGQSGSAHAYTYKPRFEYIPLYLNIRGTI